MPDTPLVLAFDTSAAHCAAVLLSGDAMVGKAFEVRARGQAEALFPMLADVMHSAGRDFPDLSGIGVGVGPGNFTGLRIAVSASRGLALGLGIRAAGVSTFEVAYRSTAKPDAEILLHAPRGSAYRQRFDTRGTASPPEIIPEVDPTACVQIDWAGVGIEILARLARDKLASDHPLPRPAPLYVRPADAAPARDAAPQLLS